MNNKLKMALGATFDAPAPTGKADFLAALPYPKATGLQLCLSQLGYIRKRFWLLSVLVLAGMVILATAVPQGSEVVGLLSAMLPLLTLTAVAELGRSRACNMAELEMTCKHSLGKITLIRLLAIGVFHFAILLLSLLLLRGQSQYDTLRYALYAATPFMLTTYLSLWVTNHLRSRDSLYICVAVTVAVSLAVLTMHTSLAVFYEVGYTLLWGMAFGLLSLLLAKEMYLAVTERNEQWSCA